MTVNISMVGNGTLIHGDALEALQQLPDNAFDALVTDPPAGIGIFGTKWDKDRGGRDSWIRWLTPIMAEALRVTKPGSYGLVWALPRTSHWTTTALEDAGWEVRDIVHHLFGTGMPKSKALLKPAVEHWVFIRKPDKRVRALQIEACRIPAPDGVPVYACRGETHDGKGYSGGLYGSNRTGEIDTTTGRWPSNLLLDHAYDCNEYGCNDDCPVSIIGEQSRFFVYQTKIAPSERKAGNNTHRTAKGVALMRWLCRLVTPESGTVIDPFCGSGGTLVACAEEGFGFTGIDENSEYLAIATARLLGENNG